MATTKAFDKMIKKELQEAVAFLKLEGKVAKLAKDPKAPTNAEFVEVLEAFKAEQDLSNPEEAKAKEADDSRETTDENGSPIVDPVATPEEVKQTMIDDYNTLIPVIITDHDNSVSIEDDTEKRVVAVRWGNPILGMTTVNVPLHGKMQYVQKGAVMRLKKISLASHIKDADGKETSNRDRKRFSVSDTTGWTPAEFEAHAQEQALKKL